MSDVNEQFDYIVVGLGGIGSGAAYWLSRQAGSKVLGLEQFELGHDRGASQDHSRIIRLSYDQQVYADLARASYAAWREIEADSGEPLLVISGGLDLFPEGGAVSPEGHCSGLQALGIPFELLDAGEIMRRYPQFRLDKGTKGIFQEQGGIAPAAKCNRAHQALAVKHGATLLDNTLVSRIVPDANGVDVVTPKTTYRCKHVIITADAWTNELLAPLGAAIPLTSTQEQVAYYAAPNLEDFMPDRFPAWIWYDTPCFYGMGVYGEETGVKVAQDVGGDEITTATRTFEPNDNTLRRVENFMRKTLPSAVGPRVLTKTCIYTMPPDRNFVIDTLPAYSNVSVGQGAGHGFKFASVIGRALSELALSGATQFGINDFAIDRPILLEANPARAFEGHMTYNRLPVV